MTPTLAFPAEGGCDCRAVRYRVETAPLVVHCCHCRWCQRGSGGAFALNAMIEADRVTSLGATPEMVHTPSESGAGQKIARCPHCKVAVWSHYAGAGPVVSFVRVGTLDNPDLLPPDVHIFTASKQPWVSLPPGAKAFEAYYEREQVWSPGSLERRQALLPRIEAYQAAQRALTAAATAPAATPEPPAASAEAPTPVPQGCVVFAKHKPRVSAFYQQTLGLQVAASDAQHDLLRGHGLEVVVHSISSAYAAQIQIAQPPRPRDETPFKPTFAVGDLAAVRAAAERTGGHLKPLEEAWRFRGCIVLDGWDPEGNIVQFKQPEPGAPAGRDSSRAR